MGLFSLFRRDLAADLERAASYLEHDEPVLAVELLRKVEKRAEGEILDRARELLGRAETELLTSLLRRADEAEAEGKLPDAADWLLSALERCDDGQRDAIEERRESLLARMEDEVNPFGEREGGAVNAGPASDEEVEVLYEAIVEALTPEFARWYRDRPLEFRRVLVELNQGSAQVAAEQLEELVAESPDDPILRLERGRALLITGDTEQARADFDSVWEELGPDPLDAAGVLSVPVLWAEATLASDPGEVAERLAPLADPSSVDLADLYATALLRLEDHDRALPFLQSVLRRAPSDTRFALHLSQILVARDDIQEATDCLEAAVGPSCSGGRCTLRSAQLPAVRALAGLHLVGESPNLERSAELMAILAQVQGGRLASEDHRILARYYELSGDEAAAADAREEAERLAALGPTAESPPTQLGAKQSVL